MEAPQKWASRKGNYHFLLCARQRNLPASQGIGTMSAMRSEPTCLKYLTEKFSQAQ